MKLSITVLSLLATFGATASINQRETAERLPTVDVDVQEYNHDDGQSQPATLGGYNAQSTALCERGYPFYCDGYCCRLNRCCARECCGSKATFCGADGLCYY